MGWQTVVAVQVQAGNTIINPNGTFVYSGPPAANNLVVSDTPAGGVDQFGNNYLAGASTYAATFATSLQSGQVSFFGGSLAGGWGSAISSVTGGAVNLQINAGGQLQLVASTNVSIQGSTSTGAGDNGGVTSGPSGTVSAFPAAGPNHTHTEIHHHPYHP